MLDLMTCEQVFNQVGSELTTLFYDQLSRIPKLVEYVFPKKLSCFFLCRCFDCFCLHPLFQIVGAHNNVLLLPRREVDRPHKVHAPLLKWLRGHLGLHGNFILWSGFPHPLTLITLAHVYPHILMKSGPIVACLQYLECTSFCCKMTSTRPIMIG